MEEIKTRVFEEMGFTKGEIKVYFALLGIGLSTIGPISKESGITPAKVYPILDKLIKKGLVKYVIKDGIKNFEATHPNNIITFLNEKEREIEREKKQINEMIPLLISKKPEEHEQKAEVYEGLGGIKAFFNELLEMSKPGDEWIGFTLGDEYLNPQANRFFRSHHKNRIRKGVSIKLLAPESQREFQSKEGGGEKNAEFRFTHKMLPTGLMIAYDKVSILLWEKEPIAFVITSKRNAEVFREFFYDMWKKAKK